MDTVNLDLLGRIRAALRREQSLSVGLAHEIVGASAHLARCGAAEQEAARFLSRDDQFRGMTAEAINAALVAEMDECRAARLTERAAGRQAVGEQVPLQRHVDAARAAGADPHVAVEQLARASAGPDHQAARRAWEAAAEARAKAEQALTELETERSRRGRKAGQLRATLEEAERWLMANGMAQELAA